MNESKRKNQIRRVQVLESKQQRNSAENDELGRLRAKLSRPKGNHKGANRTAELAAELQLSAPPPPGALRERRDVLETALERSVIRRGRGGQYGQQQLLPTVRPTAINPAVLGRTQEGRAWALSALHPCGEYEGAGLPDTYTSSICVFHLKGELNISYDVSMFPTAPATTTSYSIHAIFPPSAEIQCIYRIRADEANVWSAFRVVTWPTNPKDSRNLLTTLYDNGYASYRITSKGETVELDAPALANQGRIVIGQFAPVVETVSITALTGTGTPAEVDKPMRIDTYTYLANEDQVVNVAANPYQAEAREGAYIVHKFVNPLMGYQFHETNPLGYVDLEAATFPRAAMGTRLVGDSTGYLLDEAYTPDSYYKPTNKWAPPGNFETNQSHYGPGASPWCDMTVAQMFVVGISSGSSSTPSGAHLRVKTRQVIEAHASLPSPATVYARAPPLWDQTAVNAVVRYQEVQPDAYPACDNDFGGVMGKIFGFLSKWVRPFVKPLTSFIPGFGGLVGDVVEGGIDTGNTLLNSGASFG